MGDLKTDKCPVLIAEDEALIRLDAVSILEEAGFTVFEANGADNAIHLLEQHEEICLIFMDIDMPGSMDGLKLAHYVHDRWPPVKIVVTSGHAQVKGKELPEGGVFMPKLMAARGDARRH
jgi:CheY-like chemotaxis protein